MNETLLTWMVFILAFGGMVLIHEFGHFIAARLCKIEVEEFGIGLPTPGAITLFTWQGTRFTLNWLPAGWIRPSERGKRSECGRWSGCGQPMEAAGRPVRGSIDEPAHSRVDL